MNAAALHDAIAAVAPIYGVSLDDLANRATWRIEFKAEATPSERDAALDILANWPIT